MMHLGTVYPDPRRHFSFFVTRFEKSRDDLFWLYAFFRQLSLRKDK
jgi:hypothetical protein